VRPERDDLYQGDVVMSGRKDGLMSRLVRNRTLGMVLACMAVLPLVLCGGCLGGFPLTKTVYNFNTGLQTEIGQTLVFWAFLIIPVYSLALLGDIVIFNVIEFWTGDEVLEASTTVLEDGTTVVVSPSADGTAAVVTASRDGRVVERLHLEKVAGDRLEVRGADGELLGAAERTADGDVHLTDAAGSVVSAVTAEELLAL
jgi:hypothetical protein